MLPGPVCGGAAAPDSPVKWQPDAHAPACRLLACRCHEAHCFSAPCPAELGALLGVLRAGGVYGTLLWKEALVPPQALEGEGGGPLHAACVIGEMLPFPRHRLQAAGSLPAMLGSAQRLNLVLLPRAAGFNSEQLALVDFHVLARGAAVVGDHLSSFFRWGGGSDKGLQLGLGHSVHANQTLE